MQLKVLCFFLLAGFTLEVIAKKSKTAQIISAALIIVGCLLAIFWDFLSSMLK
jgi:hypothetical protein